MLLDTDPLQVTVEGGLMQLHSHVPPIMGYGCSQPSAYGTNAPQKYLVSLHWFGEGTRSILQQFLYEVDETNSLFLHNVCRGTDPGAI